MYGLSAPDLRLESETVCFGSGVIGATDGGYVSAPFVEEVGIGYSDAAGAKEEDVGHELCWSGGRDKTEVIESSASSRRSAFGIG